MRTTVTVNNRTYSQLFAYWPTRTSRGQLIWLEHYYMRPDRNGQGIILSKVDWILENS